MSSWQKIYQKILDLPLSLLVKTHSIPSDPVADLELDLERPIVYILPFRSVTDLLTLRSSTQALGLLIPCHHWKSMPDVPSLCVHRLRAKRLWF